MMSKLLGRLKVLCAITSAALVATLVNGDLKAQQVQGEIVVTRSELTCFLNSYDDYVAQADSLGSVVIRFEICPNLPSLADVMEALDASNSLGQPIFRDEPSGRSPIALSLEETECVADRASVALAQSTSEQFTLTQFGCFP